MISHLAEHCLPALSGVLARMAPDAVLVVGSSSGKWFFAGVFALLAVWLLLIPARRIGQEKVVPPWWRNVRFWAVSVAFIQMLVYIIWG